MKPCVVMSVDEYEKIRAHVTHAIHILDHARVSKADRDDAVRSLYAVRDALEEEDSV